MPDTLDQAGLKRLAMSFLRQYRPETRDGAFKTLNAVMGVYLEGTSIATHAVNAFFTGQ